MKIKYNVWVEIEAEIDDGEEFVDLADTGIAEPLKLGTFNTFQEAEQAAIVAAKGDLFLDASDLSECQLTDFISEALANK